jgi:hypothetical protein
MHDSPTVLRPLTTCQLWPEAQKRPYLTFVPITLRWKALGDAVGVLAPRGASLTHLEPQASCLPPTRIVATLRRMKSLTHVLHRTLTSRTNAIIATLGNIPTFKTHVGM